MLQDEFVAKEKIYTHRGVPMIVFLLLMYLLLWIPSCVIFLVLKWWFYACLMGMLGTTLCLFGLLCVYKITITIDDTYFSFKLGIGLTKKRYKIANIKSCKPYTGLRNGMGIGTKRDFNGNIFKYYMVTGSKAIELRFHDNDKFTVLIGTPLPEEISQQIQLLMGKI